MKADVEAEVTEKMKASLVVKILTKIQEILYIDLSKDILHQGSNKG